MADKKSNILLSCAYCHKFFYYSDLIEEPSYNGKWKCYRTPCKCRTEAWSTLKDVDFFYKYIKKLEFAQRG